MIANSAEEELSDSLNPHFSFEHIIFPDFLDSDLILESIQGSLFEDGYKVAIPEPSYFIAPQDRRNVPSLKLLCFENININKHVLSHYKTALPPILKRSVSTFIQIKESYIQ